MTAVDLATDQQIDAIFIVLTDARSGRVRLNLSTDMAAQSRESVSPDWRNSKVAESRPPTIAELAALGALLVSRYSIPGALAASRSGV